jgi:probable F420-dependent oxidoreductase
MLNLGLSFISPASQGPPDFLLQLAKKAEEASLSSFWINDRVGYDNFEPLAALSAVAGATSRIKIGTSILLLPLRHPVLLAKTLATIDRIAKGRVTLGVAVGNRSEDYEAAGVPFDRRGARGLESIQLMRRLWREESVTFEGEFFRVHDLALGPKPYANRSIPIWMGGGAETVLKRTARFADGYICSTSSLPNFREIWEKISTYAESFGRDPAQIEKAGLNFLAIDESSRAVAACKAFFDRYYGKAPPNIESNMIVGPPSLCAERISTLFVQLNTLILGLIIPDLSQVDLLATEVLPRLKRYTELE